MNNSRQLVSASNQRRVSLADLGDPPVAAAADRVDLSASIQFFRRRIGLIALLTAISLLIGAYIAFTAPRLYTAHAVVSLEARPSEDVGASGANMAGPEPTNSLVNTQVEILQSRELSERVARALGMLDGVSDEQRAAIIDEVGSGISAERSGESYALRLSYEGTTGELAAQRVNEYARQFARWELQNTEVRDAESISLIQGRLEDLRRDAQTHTAALQHYRIANNLMTTSGSSLTEQEISSYNQEVTGARAEAAEDAARLNTALAQLRSGSNGDDVGEALGSPVVSSLRGQEAQLAAQLASLSSRYGPNHPDLIRMRSEIAEVRERIQAEIARVISNLRAKVAVSEQRLASLTSSLGTAQSRLAASNAAMVGLDELERKAETSQGLYEAYLNSYKQLVASEGIRTPNARVLTLAEPPSAPSSPNIEMAMALSLVIGLGLGVISAFVVETLYNGVTSPDEIETRTGYRYIGSIPLLSSVSKTQIDSFESISEEPRSPFAESFRSLLTSVEQSTVGPAQVIAITSALPKEGKTETAACLARVMAFDGESTLVIDCDYARRGLSRALASSGYHTDLFTILRQEASQSLVPQGQKENLSALSITGSESHAEALLTGPAFGELLQELRQRFDRIVLDLPPVLPIAATRIIAEQADATVMLVRWRSTNFSALQGALNQMPINRINLVGVALSQVDVSRRCLFGRSDPFFYYKKYKSYYA